MPDNTVTQPGWEITEHIRDDGGTTMCAYVGDQVAWVAYQLLTPIGHYGWQVYAVTHALIDHPAALVLNKADAVEWLEHEAQHALLAAKVLTA